jgi:hypothetical protein
MSARQPTTILAAGPSDPPNLYDLMSADATRVTGLASDDGRADAEYASWLRTLRESDAAARGEAEYTSWTRALRERRA